MKQPDFIFTAKSIGLSPVQNPDGGIMLELRPQIRINHHHKNNRMMITFIESNDRFLIPDRSRLEEIYRLHLGNENLTQLLMDWCRKHLVSPKTN